MIRDRFAMLLALALAIGLAGCPAGSAPPPGPGDARTRPTPTEPSLPPSPVTREPTGDCRRAHALATRAERLADATERVHVLQQAVQLCDTEAGLLRDLGFAYRDAGDRDGARRALSRARAIDPADPSIGEALDAL